MTRERKCNLPEPKFGGLDCEGEEMEAIPCNINACPGKESLLCLRNTIHTI